MSMTMHIHSYDGKWESIDVKSYAREVTFSFRDANSYYDISIFPGDKSKLALINDLIAGLLVLGGKVANESKEREAVP